MELHGTTAWRLLAAVLVLMLFITTSDGACDLTGQQGTWWHGNTHSNQVVYVDYFNGNSTIRWRHDLQITETFTCLETSTIISNFKYFIIQSVDDPSHKECLQLLTRGSYTFYARKVVSHMKANLCESEMPGNTLNITILHHEPFTDFDTQPLGLAREKFHCSYNDSTTSNQCSTETQSVCTALYDGIVTNTCNTMSDYDHPHHNSLENLISMSGSLVGLSSSLTLSVFTVQINGTTYFYTSKTENRYPEVIIRLFYQKDGYLPIGGDQSSDGITFILTSIDECESGPCHNNATCIDGVNSYTCICPPGWTGLTCQENIEECRSLPCQNGGTCVDDINRYTCSCPAGWTGGNCETNIDECGSLPCQNGGTCIDNVNGFNCSCEQGWTGDICDTNINECLSSPCTNGRCVDAVAGFQCVCAPGWTGTACDTDVDECLSDPCQNGGNCTDKVDGFECSCVADWMGDMCQTRPSGGCFECKMSFNRSDCYLTGQWKECQSDDAVCAIHEHQNVNGEVSQFKRTCGEKVSCGRGNRTDEDSSEGTHVSEESEEEQEDETKETEEEGEKKGKPKEKKKKKKKTKKSQEDKKKSQEDKKGKSTRGRRSRRDKSGKSRGSDPKSSRESGSSASEDTESEEDSDAFISSSSEERSSSNEGNSGSRSEEVDNTTTMVTPGARRQQKGDNVVYHTCEDTVHDNSLDDCASDPCPSTATCVDTGPSYVCV